MNKFERDTLVCMLDIMVQAEDALKEAEKSVSQGRDYYGRWVPVTQDSFGVIIYDPQSV